MTPTTIDPGTVWAGASTGSHAFVVGVAVFMLTLCFLGLVARRG